MSTVSGILGDYCRATPIETFTESKNDRHPTELARLRGARLVTATETEAGRHWAESRLKELTGGESIPARFMHKDFFEYLPRSSRSFPATTSRVCAASASPCGGGCNLNPFIVTIPKEERDTQLIAKKLKAEWPGILQWMIDGCLEWQEQGLAPPEAVIRATDAYFAGEDSCANWMADCCEQVAGFVTASTTLFASWKAWAERAGQTVGNTSQFREEMERLGVIHKHGRTGNYYRGLRIRQDPPEAAGGRRCEGW